uniref:Reverse transcriptase domain-containing protein n=1 Tax=Anisakis simplex TaxID=6269 RepID=A0A0M3K5W2_ANISI
LNSVIWTSHGEVRLFVCASKHAFAAVVYLRSTRKDSNDGALVFSKTRMKPLRDISIPRLELMACLIGVRALNVEKQLQIDGCKKFLCQLDQRNQWTERSEWIPWRRIVDQWKTVETRWKNIGLAGSGNQVRLKASRIKEQTRSSGANYANLNRGNLKKALSSLSKCDEDIRNVEKLDSRKLSETIALNTLKSRVNLLRSKHEEWTRLISEMSGDERQREEEMYESYTSRAENFLEVTHLLSILHGKAKAALEGLPVTNASYNEAIDILRNRFGDGTENPADVASRGAGLRMLAEQETWWRGPDWLSRNENGWPINNGYLEEEDDETTPETVGNVKIRKDVTNIKHTDENDWLVKTAERVSTWRKLKGVVAYLIRWKNKVSTKETFGEKLTMRELEIAERKIMELTQHQTFEDVWEALLENKPHRLKKQLGIEINDELLVSGRWIPEVIVSDNATTFTAGGKVIIDECQKRDMEEGLREFGSENGLTWEFVTSHSP